jgi:hypothetical protein
LNTGQFIAASLHDLGQNRAEARDPSLGVRRSDAGRDSRVEHDRLVGVTVNLLLRKGHGRFPDPVRPGDRAAQPAEIRRNQGAVHVPYHNTCIPVIHPAIVAQEADRAFTDKESSPAAGNAPPGNKGSVPGCRSGRSVLVSSQTGVMRP